MNALQAGTSLCSTLDIEGGAGTRRREVGTRAEFEYIVVGLGGLGSAAAYWLARRAGNRVLGLEQYALGHDQGASEDHSRIIRLTYHTPGYAALSRHGFAAWRTLEEESGERLVVTTGDLLLGPRDGAVPVSEYAGAMRAAEIPFESLDADEIMRRFPQFHLADDVHGTYQPDGGLVRATAGVLAHARMARAHGATLLENTPVTSIRPLADGMEVVTADAVYQCRRLVLCTDAWTNSVLAPLGVSLPLMLSEEQVTYFASPHLEEFLPGRFPVWIWADDPNFYGIPVYGEEAGIKASQDAIGREITLETRTFEADPAALERVSSFLQRVIPRAFGPILYSKSCVYTLTPDRDFVVDLLPEHPQVAVGLGAGHGYKFAGLIGRILSDLAVDGSTSFDISAFSAARPLLRMKDPPRTLLLRQSVPGEPATPPA